MIQQVRHQFFGPNVPYSAGRWIPLGYAQQLIGAYVVTGHRPELHTTDPSGARLRTPGGDELTVIAIHGEDGLVGLFTS